MSNKEPIVLMLKDIEKLAKRINVLMRKLNAMGLQEDERKEYYSLISKYAFSRLELADRIFDSELLPSLQNDESTELSLILKSKLNWDTSLLIKPEDIDKVTNTYANIEDKNALAGVLNDYFSILTIFIFQSHPLNFASVKSALVNLAFLKSTFIRLAHFNLAPLKSALSKLAPLKSAYLKLAKSKFT